jgi:glycosyltransferase involved in cell wall biosynthesis
LTEKLANVTLNVLFCTLAYFPGITGGAERQARLQAEELVRRGHRVTVVCARTDNLTSGELNGVRIVRLRRIHRRHLFRISYMVRLLAWLVVHGREFELVHVHLANLQADIAVAVAHLFHRPAYVKVACGGAVGEVRRFGPMARVTRWYGLRHADRVQALSEEIQAELAAVGVAPERIVRIPNGIDLQEFRPLRVDAKRRLRRELGLPEPSLVTLFLGRMVDYKGIDDLLQAWPRVRAENAALVIVGATAERQVSVPPGVIVRPWTDSPRPYLQAADIFVHPSHADGMSNAVLEAMACGCALVATEHGATRQFLRGGADALLVPVRDSTALAYALDRVVGDADLRARLVAGAGAAVRAYDLGAVVDRIEAEYQVMLGAARCEDAGPRGELPRATDMPAVSEARIRG